LSEEFFDTFLWRIFIDRHVKHRANHLVDSTNDQQHVLPADVAITVTIIQLESPCIIKCIYIYSKYAELSD